MINIKTFLSLKNIASTDELDFGEIGILNEQLYFRGFDDRVYKIKSFEDGTYYTNIYGVRIPVTYPQDPAQLTDDKMERVLIKRLVTSDGNYVDTEFVGDETEMKYIISWEDGHVIEDTISQNYHPFNKMEVIDAKYNGSESTILPIFYKNKSIGRTIGNNEYIYYLISERPFDDFYPVESHLNQDGFYSKEIYLESDWREVYSEPLSLDTHDNKNLYSDCFFINASIWNDYLYYLYMIKTMSFFPFKQLVENYTPVYYTTTYSPLKDIEQECIESVDYQVLSGVSLQVFKIKLKNASSLGLKNDLNVLVGIGVGNSSSVPDIRNLPDGQTYPDFPIFTRAIVHQIEDTDDYEILLREWPTLYISDTLTYKPYIVFLAQIPYDYYDHTFNDGQYEYEDLDIDNGTLESPVRMKVDFIKNLFPVFYNADFSTTWNRTGWTLEEHLKKTTNYNTPIFFSNNSNVLYNQTSKRVNIVKSRSVSGINPQKYITCYFVNNFTLDYKEYTITGVELDKTKNYIHIAQTPQTNILLLRKINSFNKSNLETMKIVGNLEGITSANMGISSLCFVGTDENLSINANDNPATGVQGFCWNSLVCINSNAIEWLQFEDEMIKIVTRRVAYSKEQ